MCGTSILSSAASSSLGSMCSINAGRVYMFTPSFGTYYLAMAAPNIAAPAVQAVAAAPADPSNVAPSENRTLSEG
jgi:hypothetical protein